MARGEVGVEEQDEVAVGDLEAPQQVARLLEPATLGPGGVGEAEVAGHRPQLRAGRVVQNVGGDGPLVVLAHQCHVVPRVAQHIDRLTAHRQEDVDGRVPLRFPRVRQPPVRLEVEAAAEAVREQRQRQEQHAHDDERDVEPVPVVLRHEAHLAPQQQREAGYGAEGQQPGVAPNVAVLLAVVGRNRKHGVAGPGRRGRRTRSGLGRVPRRRHGGRRCGGSRNRRDHWRGGGGRPCLGTAVGAHPHVRAALPVSRRCSRQRQRARRIDREVPLLYVALGSWPPFDDVRHKPPSGVSTGGTDIRPNLT